MEKQPFSQSQEIPFSQRWSPLPRVCCINPGSKNRREEDRCHKELAWTKIHTGYPGFSWFWQFLSLFYLGLQYDSSSTHLNAHDKPNINHAKIDKFGRSDCGENEARRASASIKGPIEAGYPSSNHVSHTVRNIVSNFVKNVSNYLTPNVKKAFNQLRQAFTKALIL